MKSLPFVSLFWIIAHYSSLSDIVIQVTPYVACIPVSRVTAASCNCVCEFYFFFPWKESRMKQQTFWLKPCLAYWKRKGTCESWLPEGLRAHKAIENKPGQRVEITCSFLQYVQKAAGNESPPFGETQDLRSPRTTQAWGWLAWSLPALYGHEQGCAGACMQSCSKDGRCWSCAAPAPSPGSHLPPHREGGRVRGKPASGVISTGGPSSNKGSHWWLVPTGTILLCLIRSGQRPLAFT